MYGAADLERARPLEVLGLQPHLAPDEPRERLRAVDGRDARDAGEPLAGVLDVRKPGSLVAIADVEHALEYLAHGAERVELPPLHLVEQPPQLGIAADRALEMPLRAAGRDGEDLSREVRLSPLLEPARLLQERPVPGDARPELGHVLAADRLGEHDRRLPVAVARRATRTERTSVSIVFAAG